MERLTNRQKQVFNLIGEGMAIRNIALKLQISPRTVEVHRLHILHRLGLKSTTEIVKAWIWEQALLCGNSFLIDDLQDILGVKE